MECTCDISCFVPFVHRPDTVAVRIDLTLGFTLFTYEIFFNTTGTSPRPNRLRCANDQG